MASDASWTLPCRMSLPAAEASATQVVEHDQGDGLQACEAAKTWVRTSMH
jgi:hypothetical protein